ncbi:MAG: hypothetical protein JJLCMIEE_00301 [Acidimicrobiales bacterium]|nr:MAG: hypothetical protein EDR02_01770 [Actinomycetota bacterium]MBV6507260.1 hypothetical protein [Acidimicrobiales bacterium]RIK04130.1 MAG: hypothetical protein DCC48_14535 [Acidobacteriota bacterium]
MTVEKGKDWGRIAPLADDGVVVHRDAEARQAVEAAFLASLPLPSLGLVGGDLGRTLGCRGDEGRLRSPAGVTLPIDLGVVCMDGQDHCFLAHLVARRRWWGGTFLVAMNAAWYRDWYLGPRAHPNDGLLDITRGRLPLRDRIQARSRLTSGSHLPHPGLHTERVERSSYELDRPTPIFLDGEPVGKARHLELRVVPDALEVVV